MMEQLLQAVHGTIAAVVCDMMEKCLSNDKPADEAKKLFIAGSGCPHSFCRACLDRMLNEDHKCELCGIGMTSRDCRELKQDTEILTQLQRMVQILSETHSNDLENEPDLEEITIDSPNADRVQEYLMSQNLDMEKEKPIEDVFEQKCAVSKIVENNEKVSPKLFDDVPPMTQPVENNQKMSDFGLEIEEEIDEIEDQLNENDCSLFGDVPPMTQPFPTVEPIVDEEQSKNGRSSVDLVLDSVVAGEDDLLEDTSKSTKQSPENQIENLSEAKKTRKKRSSKKSVQFVEQEDTVPKRRSSRKRAETAGDASSSKTRSTRSSVQSKENSKNNPKEKSTEVSTSKGKRSTRSSGKKKISEDAEALADTPGLKLVKGSVVNIDNKKSQLAFSTEGVKKRSMEGNKAEEKMTKTTPKLVDPYSMSQEFAREMAVSEFDVQNVIVTSELAEKRTQNIFLSLGQSHESQFPLTDEKKDLATRSSLPTKRTTARKPRTNSNERLPIQKSIEQLPTVSRRRGLSRNLEKSSILPDLSADKNELTPEPNDSIQSSSHDSSANCSLNTSTRSRMSDFDGPKRNHKGELPLHIACRRGHIETVKRLIEVENMIPNVVDNNNWTPLYEAANTGHVEIVKFLLEQGASVHVPGGVECGTALHAAVQNGFTDVVRLLVTHGANVNAMNVFGVTPLSLVESTENQQQRNELEKVMKMPVIDNLPQIRFNHWLVDRPVKICFSTSLLKESPHLKVIAKKMGAQISEEIKRDVTHYIVKMTKDKDVTRKTKVLQSLLVGVWVVNVDWLRACDQQGCVVDESQYEARHILSPEKDQSKAQILSENAFSRARQLRMEMNPGLFSGLSVFFPPKMWKSLSMVTYDCNKLEVTKMIEFGDGVPIYREPTKSYIRNNSANFETKSLHGYSQLGDHSVLVVCSVDEQWKCADSEKLLPVSITWLLECIGKMKFVPVY